MNKTIEKWFVLVVLVVVVVVVVVVVAIVVVRVVCQTNPRRRVYLLKL